MHQADLALDDLLAVLRVLHGRALQVEVLGIDGLFIEELREFSTQVFHPVVPLRPGAMITQRFDVKVMRVSFFQDSL
jgi:hypothetical protein